MKTSHLRKYARRLTVQAVDLLEKEGITRYDETNDQIVREVYFGNVLDIYPSGKYYLPFACSNVEPCPKCRGEGTIPNPRYDEMAYKALLYLEWNRLREMKDSGKHYKIMPKQWQREMDLIRQVIRMVEPKIECPCCYGVGSREAYEDQVFTGYFEEYLAERDIYITASDGDGCDMIVGTMIERDTLIDVGVRKNGNISE